MANNIQIDTPVIANSELKATITVRSANGTNIDAVVNADLSELLPWLNTSSQESVDFAFLSFFIYGIDRLIPRRPNSIDGWSRLIDVDIPVYKLSKWKASKLIVEKLLSFLTGDYWKVSFYKNTCEIPQQAFDKIYNQNFAQVNLFSGGLDSLIGAIDALEKTKLPVLFISHYDPTMAGPKKDQGDLGIELEAKYNKWFVRLPSVKVFLSESSMRARETTSRSRSILFIGLALVLANAKKINIVVPENGTVSVNYPLSPSRRSACSTRTTHPTFLGYIFELWQQLGISTTIENPYRFKTKAEMVNECSNNSFLLSVVALSNSCGKRGHRAHWDTSGTHCGICMPCLYRRASLINIKDSTRYGNDINGLVFQTKKGQDVSALLDFLKASISKNDIKFELVANGLRDIQHLYDYIKLVQKTRNELAAWIKKEGNSRVRSKAGL